MNILFCGNWNTCFPLCLQVLFLSSWNIILPLSCESFNAQWRKRICITHPSSVCVSCGSINMYIYTRKNTFPYQKWGSNIVFQFLLVPNNSAYILTTTNGKFINKNKDTKHFHLSLEGKKTTHFQLRTKNVLKQICAHILASQLSINLLKTIVLFP